MRMRWEHDSSWISPEAQRGNLPNEEFFVRKTDGRSTLVGISLDILDGVGDQTADAS